MTNDHLLVRALGKGRSEEPCADFTVRVMERIGRERKMRERRENRVLLAGAVCGCAGLIAFAVLVVGLYAGTAFSALGQTASQIWTSAEEIFRGVGAVPNPASDAGGGTLLWLWSYMALLFLAFSITGEVLRRKHL